MASRRILITGAAGFVGRNLSAGFAASGWDVVAVDRAFAGHDTPAAETRIVADLSEGMPHDVPAADVVVHAAWVTTSPAQSGDSRAAYMRSNLDPLLATLDYAERARPAAFVFLSSSGVFGPRDGTDGLRDADLATGTSAYAVSKRAGEDLTRGVLDRSTTAHVVRLGYLFGPHERAGPTRSNLSHVAGWMAAARAGEALRVRSDDPLREWTFAPDLVAALERMLDGPPRTGPTHLGNPRAHRDREVAGLVGAAVAKELGRAPATSDLVPEDAAEPLKPPMVPSELAVLENFRWTSVDDGLAALCGTPSAAGLVS